jgi:TldD protein
MNITLTSQKNASRRARGKNVLRGVACCALAAQLAGVPIASAAGDGSGKTATAASDAVLKTMQTELARATAELGKSDPAPYYLSYTVYDQNAVVIVGAYGSLLTNTAMQRRQADVTMRVGSPALDNTHGQSRPSGITSGTLPLGDEQDAMARVLWELTDREYKRAAPAFLNVRTNTAVRAEEEDKSPDFSKETAKTHIGDSLTPPPFDRPAWEGEVRRLSGAFRKYPEVYFATVVLQVQVANARMVSSEGSAITSPSASTRLVMEAQTRADDGMELLRVETFQAPAASGLPGEAELLAKIEKMAADLKALRSAPVAEPYDGPAMLSGRAAAVFFHEVLGHRLEGHRQKDEDEGQTFTKKVNQEVLPKFLSVADDPTIHELAGMKLAGS